MYHKKIIPVVLFILSIITSLFLIIQSNKRVNILSCETGLSIFFPQGHSLHAIFQGFVYSDHSGFSTYKGILEYKGERYIINRDIPFTLTNDNNGGIMTLKYLGVIKKPNDTVPDEVMWHKIYRAGVTYYPTISKTDNGDFLLTDRGGLTYACANTNK